MAGRERVVNMRIKAQDDYSAELLKAKAALRDLTDAQAAATVASTRGTAKTRAEVEKLRAAYEAAATKLNSQTRVGGTTGPLIGALPSSNLMQTHIGNMQRLQGAALATRAEYERMRKETAVLGRALAQIGPPTENAARDFDLAKQKLAALRAEMGRQEAALARYRQAGTTGFRGSAVGLAGATVAAASAKQQGFFEKMTSAWSTQHGRGPLGLRPYELTNLGYQINDLATQMASGTSFAQAFAQQIGQIAQIFPDATLGVLKMAPAIIGLTAVLVPLIAAFSRVREEQRLTMEFTQRLTATVDNLRYDPKALTQMVRDLQQIGVSAKDSQAAINTMMQQGVDTSRMSQFIMAAQDVSSVWGTEFADSLKTVREGFDGTYESLAKLDDQFNFLTAAQRKQIREMYETGKATEATTKALNIFMDKQDAAADLAQGGWSTAFQHLANAWRGFLDQVAQTGAIAAAQAAVNGLSRVVSVLAGTLAALNNSAAIVRNNINDAATLMEAVQMGGGDMSNVPRLPSQGGRARMPVVMPSGAQRQSEAELKADEERRAKIKADAEKLAADQAMEAWANYTRSENKAREDLAEMNRKRREDEKQADIKAAKERNDAIAAIDQKNDERRFEASIAMMSDLDQAIQRNLRAEEQRLASVGISMDQKSRDEIIATTTELYRQTEARKALDKANKGGGKGKNADDERKKKLEKTLNDLLEYRKGLLEQIEFHENRGENAQASALEGQIPALNEQIKQAIANLDAFWAKMNGPEALAARQNLKLVELSLTDIGKTAAVTGEDINEMLSEGAADGLDQWMESVANGENVLTSLRDAFLQFASDFLREIARMIAQQAILNALQQGGGPNGGIGGMIAGAIGHVLHTGGIVGRPGGVRRHVPSAVFATAPRMHTGGIAGLRRGEVPAILDGRKGREEEVITRDDPRHSMNGGRAGGGTKIVNVFDPADLLKYALADEAGQKVLMNFVSSNPRRFNAALGGR